MMKLDELFQRIEATLSARLNEAGFVQHSGDKGENREQVLMEFLSEHLPSRYGIAKGEVITKSGERSHSADLIIFDRATCPVLYSGRTKIIPIEGVYGIIEVKSTLSKAEFDDCITKIEQFKRLAPRDLSVIQTRGYVTVERSSRPFGLIIGCSLGSNSLESLVRNWQEQNQRIHDVNCFTNAIAVLGQGILYFEKVDLDAGEKYPLLGTDEVVQLVETAHKRERNKEPQQEVLLIEKLERLEGRTFGRLFTFLLSILSRMKLNPPDLGQYVDPDMPHMVIRE
jgi:hypothetical protein